ncbi:MAG: hypothetical protein JXR69_00465 [Candidatus Delongbacteria bacterium]|nr:hypothetical protein [Candidatus Delongbacteria bacterium]
MVVRLYGLGVSSILSLIMIFNISSIFSAGIQFKVSVFSDLGLIQSIVTDNNDEFDFAGVSSFSLTTKRKFNFGKFESAFDVIVPYGGSVEEYFFTNISDIKLSTSSGNVELFSIDEVPVLFDLRKFYFSVYFPLADLTVGRQIINFGKGVFFSPADVFSTVELSDINFRRRGSDIVDLQIPISSLSGIDIISEFPYSDKIHSTAIKYFNTINNIDISLLGIYKNAQEDPSFSDELLSGVAFKGDIEVGLYGEVVLHYLSGQKRSYFEGMIGTDYSIENKWFFNLEYLYKQSDWEYSYWGEHDIFGSVSYSVNDLTRISTSLVYDIKNEMTLGSIQYFYNMLQNMNTILYIQGIDSSEGSYLKYSARVEWLF